MIKPPHNVNDPVLAAAWRRPFRQFMAAARELLQPAGSFVEDRAFAAARARMIAAAQSEAGMARAGIMGDYAARMRYVRKQLRREQWAAVLCALAAERRAALDALERRIEVALKSRLVALRRLHRPFKSPAPGG